MSVERWIEKHDREADLARRVAGILNKDIVNVLTMPHEKLIEELVKVIENERKL